MVEKSLEERVASGTLMHAYLISGPADSDKEELSALIAQAAVCSGEGKKPCRKCENCRKAEAGGHPDIISVVKQKDRKEIGVDKVREELVWAAYVLPNDAERKVFIIRDQLNTAAQNALLKVLEEPPRFVTIIILTDNPGNYLQTIRSRCVEISLNSNENENVGGEEAELSRQILDAAEKKADFDIVRLMFSCEKMEKNAFLELVQDCGISAARRAEKAAFNGDGQTQKMYLKAVSIFIDAEKYLGANVSVGHSAGLVMAGLCDLCGKK